MPHRAWNRAALALAVAALAAATVGESAWGALRLVRVAGGFSAPVYAIGAPGNRNALFVVSQEGIVTRLVGGSRSPFLDIRDRVAYGGERGLFSIAFHPRYAQNRRFFVYYTNNVGDLRIVEFRANASGTRTLPGTAKVWVGIRHRLTNHNGGQLAFGRNGLLYIGTGDGGGGGDPNNNAQRRTSRLGKLLYLNVNRPRARARIAALGLRNPWRFSVDRKTGHIWIGDVGQDNWEEIDRFRPGRAGLENYGWSRWEGRHLYRSDRRLGAGRLIQPRHEYANGRRGRCSVTGGFMVRGNVPGRGRYFFGDYCSGEVWSFRFMNGRKSGFRREPFRVPDALSSFGLGPRGGLLAVSHGGAVYRVANR